MMRTSVAISISLVLCAVVAGRMLGGYKTVDDVNSAEYDGLKEYIQQQINARSNSLTPPQLTDDMQISQQVVAGMKYKVVAKDGNGNVYNMEIFRDLSGQYHTNSFSVNQNVRSEGSARSTSNRGVVGGYSDPSRNGFDDDELSAFEYYRKNTSEANADDLVLCSVTKQVVAGINFKLMVAHGSCNNAQEAVVVYRALDGSMKIV